MFGQFFFKYGFSFGEKTYTVKIPDAVKKNINQENIYSLLSGLADSDGHLEKGMEILNIILFLKN